MKTETKHTPGPLFWIVGNQLQWKATSFTAGVADLPPEVAAELATLRADKTELLSALEAAEFTLSAMMAGDADLAKQVETIRALIAKHSKATT